MRLLVLYPYLPYPLDRGTYHRTYHLLRTLAGAHTVDLIALCEAGQRVEHVPHFESFCHSVQTVSFEHPAWAKMHQRLFHALPTSVQHWDIPAVHTAVEQALSSTAYDAAYVCDIVMAQFFLSEATRHIPLIIDRSRVDLLFQRAQRQHLTRGIFNHLNDLQAIHKTAQYERRIAARSALQIVCGPDDRDYLRQHVSQTLPIAVVPNGVDPEYFSLLPSSDSDSDSDSTLENLRTPQAQLLEDEERVRVRVRMETTILFCGAMDYTPNIDALRWYFADIHPLLLQRVPGVQVLLVGKDPVAEVQAYGALPGVTVTGSVPDVRPYYRAATLQMVPLRIGGGTRLKIVESLAIGTPVVSTSIGAQGLDLVHGQDLLLADTPATFATELARALQDSALCDHLREHGHRTVQQRLTWKALGEELLEALPHSDSDSDSSLELELENFRTPPTQLLEDEGRVRVRVRMDTSPQPVPLLGIPFHPVTFSQTLAHIQERIQQRQPSHIVTANVDFTHQVRSDRELHHIIQAADLVLCDGQPLIWASRLLGRPLPERVAGSDLVPQLLALAAQQGHRVFILGGAPRILEAALQRSREKHPALKIEGYSPAHLPLEQMDHEAICQRIRAAAPDILLVSFGCPKQEKWIARFHKSLEVPISIGVGATVDFLAGAVARAPRWMHPLGLEWIWRLSQEPKRLLSRYWGNVCHFVPALLREWFTECGARSKRQGAEQPAASPTTAPQKSEISNQQSEIPLHVALSATVLQRGKSGVGQYLLALVRELCEQPSPHRFSLFVLEGDLPLFAFAAQRFQIIPVAEAQRSAVRDILWHQFTLPRLVKKLGIDVLHIPSYRRMVWADCCTKVTTIHDLAPFHLKGKYDPLRSFYARHIVPRLARRQDQILAISQHTAKDIQHFLGIPRSEIKVVLNGIDHSRFGPVDSEQPAAASPTTNQQPLTTSPSFLFVSRIEHPAKNHVRLIDAFTQFKQRTGSDWQLHLAGSDWHRAEVVHDHAARSPFAADIRFLGFVSDAELPALYRSSSVFVYPSLFEGFGLPPIEAMACGLPVISSTAGALAEVVADAAEHIDPTSVESIATALERLSSDAALRHSLTQRGLLHAQQYHWSQTAAQVLETYSDSTREVLDRPRPSSSKTSAYSVPSFSRTKDEDEEIEDDSGATLHPSPGC